MSRLDELLEEVERSLEVTPQLTNEEKKEFMPQTEKILNNTNPQQKPSFGESLKASFELDNVFYGTVSSISRFAGRLLFDDSYEEDFSPLDNIDVERDEKYLPYIDDILKTTNRFDFNFLLNKIDRELENRDIINRTGTGSQITAGLIAGIIDPINFIPIGGSAYKSYKSGQIIKGMVKTSGVGLASASVQEGILQSQQVTRTAEETITNIAGSTILSGTLGGAAATISKARFNKLSKDLDKVLSNPEPQFKIDLTGEIQGLGGNKIAKGVAKSLKKLNPALRLLESNSETAKEILPKLARLNVYTDANMNGIANYQSVEIAQKIYQGNFAIAKDGNQKLYKQYVKRMKRDGFGKSDILNFTKFKDEVSLAMIKNDTSAIKEVAESASGYRKAINVLRDAAQSVKLLSEDLEVETADSYLTRMYNINKIVANQQEFEDIIATASTNRLIPKIQEELKESFGDLTQQEFRFKAIYAQVTLNKIKNGEPLGKKVDVKKLKKDLPILKLLAGDLETVNDFSRKVAEDVVNKLKGIDSNNNLPYDLEIKMRGSLKPRTLNFVKDIEIRDFLETDPDIIVEKYTRQLGVDVELQRRFSNVNLTKEIESINNEYNALAKKATTKKERLRLEKERKSVESDIVAMRDLLRGHYISNPDHWARRGAQALRQYNYITKLGGVAVSSIPDTARLIMIHGIGKFFKNIKRLTFNRKALKLALSDSKTAGIGMEKVLHTRSQLLADINNQYSNKSAFESTLSSISEKFGKLNLIDFWNDAMKGFASIHTQERLIDNITNFSKVKPKEKSYMALLGIDDKNLGIIKDQLSKYGDEVDGIKIANLDKWDDQDAVRLYTNALNLDVDRTIVTKGIADVPLVFNTELGKTIFQFKAFSFASLNQTLIAGLQQADLKAVTGVATMISLGMFVEYIKSLQSGRKLPETDAEWIAAGIDRSGLLSVVTEMHTYGDAFGIGASSILPDNIARKRYYKDVVGTLGGASTGTIKDLAQSTEAIATQDFSKSDIKAMRRMIPLQNLFYLRNIFDKLEEEASDELVN